MADSKDTPNSISLRSHIRTCISELDTRILALEESLGATRCERENLERRLDNCKYPVLTLPVEVTSEIFIACLPEYPECPPMDGLLSPTLLGQICRKWREIALDTLRLWRAIELHLWNKSAFDAQLTVLNTWLSRSKGCSFSLSLKKVLVESPTFSELPQFTDTIISHSARWEQIELYCPSNELDWIEGTFSQLRQLNLRTYGYDAQASRTLFDDAPHLTSVLLSVHFDQSQVVLPWSQLTRINAVRVAPAMAAHILRQATALASLRCTLWDAVAVPGALPPLVHLQSLMISDGNKNLFGPKKLLLDALTTPALRYLSVSGRELDDDPILTISSLLSRSHCVLDSLHVTHSLHEAD
ncbi:hypothetical protein C8J57DRAFT_1605415 [Mycena rebaudengoi]|nr:hypothetical protein C8J57DRAFT_1605415 [Mycena rebaudengoi]